MRHFLPAILSVSIFLGLSTTVSAQPPVMPEGAKIQSGPWVVKVTENEMTVVWTSDQRCMGWVEVAPDDGSHFYACERPRYYEDFMGRHLVSLVHKITVKGLQKGTTYRYRILQQAIDDHRHSPLPYGPIASSDVYRKLPYKITTLDLSKPTCKFSVVNDIHGRDSLLLKLTNGIVQAKPDFFVFNGDMVSLLNSREDVEKSFMNAATESFSPNLPLVYVRGNHETRGPAFSEYLNLFPTTSGQPYFIFRHGPVAFVAIDCGEDKPDSDIEYGGTAAYDRYREAQAEWLREAVKSSEFADAPVKIAFSHIPFSDKAAWHGNIDLQRLMLPILNEAGVHLMLSAHNHNYSYYESGEAGGNKFPILVNDDEQRLDIEVDASKISMKIYDVSGKLMHEHVVNVK